MFKLYDSDLKSSISQKRGRYVSGGLTDVFPKRLGWWERDLSFMERRIDDISFIIDIGVERRLDLVSFIIYKRPDFEWLIMQYNNIVDINEEVITGKILIMPNPTRAMFDITS